MQVKTYTPTGRTKECKAYDLENCFGKDENVILVFTETDYEGDDKSKTIDVELTKEEFDRLAIFFQE